MTTRDTIETALAEQTPGSHHVPLDGGYLEVPVIDLPIDTLLYRPENGRIAVEELSYLRRQGLPEDYFAGDPAEAEIQRVLEDLLLEIARDPRGPIYEELARAGQQTEPLIINRAGIVINGNRRLAAMRELHRQDPDRYPDFARVKAAVLPADIDEAAEERIEAALQMAPETKLAYGWVHRRLKLRRQRDSLGLPEDSIIQAYRLEGPEQLERELAELALAEDYLESFADAPGEYERIGDETPESLFIGLHAQLADLKKPLARAWKQAGFAMIHARGQVDAELENYFPFRKPRPAHAPTVVLNRLGAELNLWQAPEAAEERTVPAGKACRQLAGALTDPGAANDNARILIRLMDAVALAHREQRAPKIAVKRLREVSDLMNGVELERLSGKELGALKSQLAALEYQARSLREACEARDRRSLPARQYHWLRRQGGRVLRAVGLR